MTKPCPYCLNLVSGKVYCDGSHQRKHEVEIERFDIAELKGSFIGESVSEYV